MSRCGSMAAALLLALAVLLPGAARAQAAAGPAPELAPEQGAQPWSLQRCLEAALRSSPRLQETREQAAAGAAGAAEARARLWPVLGADGSYDYVSRTMSIHLPALPGMAPRTIRFGDGSTADLMLGARAPLFHGGALRQDHQAAEATWRAGLQTVAADSLDLRLQVQQAFFGALGGAAAADAARQGEQRLQRHLRDVEANLQIGTATEEARLQVLGRLRQAEQATIGAEAAAAAQRFALGRLVGQPGEEIVPAGELTEPLLPGGEPLPAVPLAERPSLRALDFGIAAAGHRARAAAGSFWPAIDLQGGWHYGRPGVNPVADEWMSYGTVGVGASWTLFDFGARRHRVGQARARQRALQQTRADADDALRTRLANARRQLDAAGQERDKAAEAADVQGQRWQLAQGRWQQGHATETELLDAQDDMTVAGIELALAQARLRLAEAELLSALGY